MNQLIRKLRHLLIVVPLLGPISIAAARTIDVDLSGYASNCGVEVERQGERLLVRWPMGGDEAGRLTLDLRPGQPLIESLGIAASPSKSTVLLRAVEPLVFVTVGTRQAPPGRPPQMSPFNTFFDKPAKRPHQSF